MDLMCCGQCHFNKSALRSSEDNAARPPKRYQKTGRVFAKERVKTAKEVKPHTLLPIIALPKTESPEGRDCVKMGAVSLSDREQIDRFSIYF